MGNTGSAQTKEQIHTENIKNMLKGNNHNEDIETSIGYEEISREANINSDKPQEKVSGKLTLPKLKEKNGVTVQVSEEVKDMTGGKFDIRGLSSRQRYHKYDVFKALDEIENNMRGGNQETDSSITTDDKAMDHIKNVILSQLKELEKHKQHGAGSCGCDKKGLKKNIKGGYFDSSSSTSSETSSSDTDSSEFGLPQNKKNYIIEESESSNFLASTSQTGGEDEEKSDKSSSSESPEVKHSKHSKHSKNSKHSARKHKETSNGEDEETEEVEEVEEVEEDQDESNQEGDESQESEEGLSIFPFNSSDIKSSASVKNYKMLRRKI